VSEEPDVAVPGVLAVDPPWDHEVDLLVVGSGGGGMAAALTAHDAGLSTLIVEKSATFGGSTAISGGGIWIPNNPTLRRKGVVDDPASVVRYLQLITEGSVPTDRIEAFVAHGPPLMELLEQSPHVTFSWVEGYADYHPEVEGGRPAGRTVEAKPFDTRKLGEEEQHQRDNLMKGPMGLWITAKDYHDLAMVKRTWRGRRAVLIAVWRVVTNLFRRRHMATGGRALIARLRMALGDARIPLWLAAPAQDLLLDEDGVVQGMTVCRAGHLLRVRARHGVLIASGGFEHNPELRERYLPEGGRANVSAGAVENEGDGILAGERVGAALDLMDDAWWMPSVRHPRGAVIPLVSERAIPRAVIVDGSGKRFTNEAAPYVNFVHDQLAGGHLPAWFITDATGRKRYPFAHALPGQELPGSFYKHGIAHEAGSLHELAERIDVPAEALEATIERFNGFARDGEDRDFHRGESAYDRYYGDPTLPNPNLDEITDAPFYAIRIEVGDLGTKGGLVCDAHSRVLRPDGSVIEGLYATGNASASVMGHEYAGAGATIGPAMVFGYIAAQHAAQRAVRSDDGASRAPDPRRRTA
jgi:3-oxosteroid 1-dehydrogenase